VQITSSSGNHVCNLKITDGVARTEALSPGRYLAKVHDLGTTRFEIRADAETKIEVRAAKLKRASLRILGPIDIAKANDFFSMRVEIFDSAGDLCDQITVKPSYRRGDGWSLRARRPPNEQTTVVVQCHGKERDRATFAPGAKWELTLH